MTRLKTIVVGGSNTVMEPGYLSQLLGATAARGIELDIVENLAVGGTTSAYGLFGLKSSAALERADLLLIEYALNDAFIYGDERRQFRHWARIYEGILRYALARNPRLRIVTLIFGARNGSWLNSVPSIDAGIRYLSDWYGAGIINVSRELIRRFGRQVVTDPAFYVDQGHYSRPVATAMVADIAADAMGEALARSRLGALPPAIDPDHFADATVISAADIFDAADGAKLSEFHNRRFAFSAVDLAQHRLRLDLEGGKLIGIFHMSTPNIGALSLTRNGTLHHCSLLKGGVRDGKFKFLAAMLPCEFLYGADLLAPAEKESYELSLAGDDPAAKVHVAKDNVAPAKAPAEPQIPLLGLLYTGTCRDFRLEGQIRTLKAANSA